MADTPGEAGPIRMHTLAVTRTARVAVCGESPADEAWLVLHGYGQLAERFLRAFEPAARPGRLVVAPEALSRFYTSREPSRVGATWMTREDREAEIHDYLGYLDRVMEQVVAPAGATRFEVHAFSQGTATATRWLAHTTRRVDRLVLWGGAVAPEVDLAELHRLRPGLEWQVCVGRADEYITAAAVEAEAARFAAAGIAVSLTWFAGGHQVDPEVLAMLAQGS